MPDLKPCPFCGGEAVVTIESAGWTSAAITCLGCNAYTERHIDRDYQKSKTAAIAAWNRRVKEVDNEL